MNQPLIGLKLNIRGIVQGVGFRPFIFSLAVRHHLTGWVINNSNGVEIEVDGSSDSLNSFVNDIRHQLPPLASIDTFHIEEQPAQGYTTFEIRRSQENPGEFIPISPDVSICDDCWRELFDPANRRYRYPFINCTNCGPRFTITQNIPYDRPNTTMAGFPLCNDCLAEYQNPLDRRFHAQPVACEVCGPALWYEEDGRRLSQGEAALQAARKALRQGKVIAIKGLGGYHIACDAANESALERLRERKRRSDKPFALMAFSLEVIQKYAIVSDLESKLLLSRQKPIVLLEKSLTNGLPDAIAPQQHTLGFMLPYTPLHALLLEPSTDYPEVLVMTSGNLSEEPIAYEDADAIQRLTPMVDGFLLHNRPIHMRVDDSVMRVMRGSTYPIRRSRGYAPEPIRTSRPLPEILACGGELKNAFCLSRDQYAFMSHHIGDMENYETERSFEQGIQHFEKLFRIHPTAIACDSHPNYLASTYARERSNREQLPLIEVQHHHAHLAACLAEHNLWDNKENVIGCIFDGTGYGSDGAIWGGEFLIGNAAQFQRITHLPYVPQPGGDAATRHPARMALAHLWKAGIVWQDDLPPLSALSDREQAALQNQLEKQVNCPQTSSMGRFFDAVSSLIGVRQHVNYEGQAAIELEAIADGNESGCYPMLFSPTSYTIDLKPFWQALLADHRTGTPTANLAARSHNSIVQLCEHICDTIRNDFSINTVVLSGGVWQNRYLFDRTVFTLENQGFQVLTHQKVPANDGGIALGQIAVADSALKQ